MPSDLTLSQRRLAAAQSKRARQALGPPLVLSDADMTVLTNVGPTDQPEAQAFAWAAAGQPALDMMRAE